MKTIITFLSVALFMVNPISKTDGTFTEKESGKMKYSVVYKETENMVMGTGGVPQTKSMKVGQDFDFEFSFNRNNGRFQKLVSEEEKFGGKKQMMISGASFSFGGGEEGEEPALPIDEFDTAVFNFDENIKIGLATVLKKDISVEVPLVKEDLGLQITGKTKKILGYKAYEAVSEDGEITVWYTEELNIHSLWQIKGIEGVVLSFEDDNRTITASDLTLGTVDQAQFDLPERKLLELEQYQDLKKEEMDETMRMVQERLKKEGMNISLGSGGGIVIKKGNNN